MPEVGEHIHVQPVGVAHGGAMIAHLSGPQGRATVFVRHALPGEAGRAVVTGVRSRGRIVFADMVEIVSPAAGRVAPPCSASGPGGCGGCDFQHIALPVQRELKAEVVRDCLVRIGRFDLAAVPWDGSVRAVPGDEHGLRWRTRGRFLAAAEGLAMRRYRSADPVAVADCPITQEAVLDEARSAAAEVTPPAEVFGVRSSQGDLRGGPTGRAGRETVRERVAGRSFRVAAEGFWQVHPGAPLALVDEVLAVLSPQADEVLLDLFAGVGLFGAVCADAVPLRRIEAVEGDRTAARHASANLADIPGASVHRAPVLRWLRDYQGEADLVVLDPPRTGAGAAVLAELDRLRPRAISYVACDPAALARDLRTMADLGWRLEHLAAFDMFPMTHHIECVAGLSPTTR